MGQRKEKVMEMYKLRNFSIVESEFNQNEYFVYWFDKIISVKATLDMAKSFIAALDVCLRTERVQENYSLRDS